MAGECVFRPLRDDEEALGYEALLEVVDWLRRHQIALWEHPLPREVYHRRQQAGENFGLFVDGELAVILSLLDEPPGYWSADIRPPMRWLSTLASRPAFKGRHLGRQAVEMACEHVATAGIPRLYLDCKPGRLVDFYFAIGFERVAQKQVAFDDERVFDVVLCRKDLTRP